MAHVRQTADVSGCPVKTREDCIVENFIGQLNAVDILNEPETGSNTAVLPSVTHECVPINELSCVAQLSFAVKGVDIVGKVSHETLLALLRGLLAKFTIES